MSLQGMVGELILCYAEGSETLYTQEINTHKAFKIKRYVFCEQCVMFSVNNDL